MTKRPKHIIISHVYSSDNKGDAALTSVLIHDLRRQWPKAKVTILRLESVGATSRFEGVPERPAFMHFALNKYRSPLAKLTYTLYMIPATLLWAAWHHRTHRELWLPQHLRATARLYAQADLIVAVGGGYVRSRTGLFNRLNIPLLLHPLLFAHLLGKPTALYAQSVGPLVHAYERPMVAFVLRRMLLILLREDISMRLLASMGVTRNVMRAVDSGFLLHTHEAADLHRKFHIPASHLIVGVTVRSWLTGSAQARYEQAVATALDNFVKQHNASVLFIPQVTAAKGDDDRQASQRVVARMHTQGLAHVITDQLDHYAIKAIYNGLDVLLGTRFHSVIFSLTSFVPVVAIEYEHKTSGIMRDVELEEWVIAIEQVTAEKLTDLLEKLVREQASYRRHLRRVIPPYVNQAKAAAQQLAKSYGTLSNHSVIEIDN